MRPAVLFASALLVLSLLTAVGPVQAQGDEPKVLIQPGDSRDEVTFSTDNGPQFIVVRDFKVTEVQPTGKEDEYALTLLALTQRGEPDQRVMGGILFEIDGKSILVPFQQGGVGDVTVRARPDADEITLRAVDSNVTHQAQLPTSRPLPWILGGGVALLFILVAARRFRARRRTAA